MKKKIFSVFFALVLVLSFGLVGAPVAAATTNVNLRSGNGGAAEWSTDEVLSGTYSAKLSVIDWESDYGLVNIFFEGILLEDLVADPTFYAKGVTNNGLGPYLNILLENPTQTTYDPTGTYNDALEGVLVATPSDNTWGTEWELMVGTASYNDMDGSLGKGSDIHDLAYWQSEVPGMLVVGVQIFFGKMGSGQTDPNKTVYIDDVTINGTLYDLEPATGAVTMSASSLLPAPFIGIEVTPTTADFGQLDPGVASDPAVVINLLNTGNVAEDFTASILNESHPPVYQDGLQIAIPQENLVVVALWEELNVPAGVSLPLDLILTVPLATVPGTYTATLVFWAEATVVN